ncbi:MAG TPA: hypothetical protein VE712_04785 [Actinomycetota bacterium]|nr:hypothetical protein [Actinomycetota bacterium]
MGITIFTGELQYAMDLESVRPQRPSAMGRHSNRQVDSSRIRTGQRSGAFRGKGRCGGSTLIALRGELLAPPSAIAEQDANTKLGSMDTHARFGL